MKLHHLTEADYSELMGDEPVTDNDEFGTGVNITMTVLRPNLPKHQYQEYQEYQELTQQTKKIVADIHQAFLDMFRGQISINIINMDATAIQLSILCHLTTTELLNWLHKTALRITHNKIKRYRISEYVIRKLEWTT